MFAEAFEVPEITVQVKLCLQAFAFILICLQDLMNSIFQRYRCKVISGL